LTTGASLRRKMSTTVWCFQQWYCLWVCERLYFRCGYCSW